MSYHSVEVMVYQYDKLFGCPNPNPHFYILVGYFWGTIILNWLRWQPAGKFRVPQKYKTVGYGWDTSHPTTISKKFIILIYHYLHAVFWGSRSRSLQCLLVSEAYYEARPAQTSASRQAQRKYE